MTSCMPLHFPCQRCQFLPCGTNPVPCSVVVVGRSTCPFCIEVTRTLTGMGLAFPYLLGGCSGVRGSGEWVAACLALL